MKMVMGFRKCLQEVLVLAQEVLGELVVAQEQEVLVAVQVEAEQVLMEIMMV